MKQDATAVERIGSAALEAQIGALKEVGSLLREQLEDVRKDRDAWRAQAEANQRLLVDARPRRGFFGWGSRESAASRRGRPKMSKWQAEKAEKNRRSLARLNRALPGIFPSAVLSWALSRPFVPPDPAAFDKFIGAPTRSAPIGLARALAARSGAPSGWTWQLDATGKHGLPATHRAPPAPYRERPYNQGSGFCCVCGQPVYRFGWHVDLWDSGANTNASWHCACVIAWAF